LDGELYPGAPPELNAEEVSGPVDTLPARGLEMAAKITVARQRNAVSQGMAFDKMRVDLAFEHAWLDWPDRYRSQFPQVSTDLRNGSDAVWVMTHADEQKQVTPLFWGWSGGPITIHQRGSDWESDDPGDVAYALSMIPGAVPLEGWLSLARDFLSDFDREYG
jgi:hypothetical protein